ncbi:MAG: hypothetical protein A2787_06640 [Omnitrophica WOR_2 bacterium RIFCSPHIGHO2_01_FULL_48_9]|nr:MAG: hypothetical protein A3D10_05495 [Omnitrophica WOR_2 bacterium RIFCSPHIGHO2_02_FULL_48_11]OGX30454.1 MAG: hypothetical protein A2787_06640 [Omnitrophica WOR_2 bacterium RIFCSPHIGHO2_01_FULL_48_9]
MGSGNENSKLVVLIVLFFAVMTIMYVTNSWIKRELDESSNKSAAVQQPLVRVVEKEKLANGDEPVAQSLPASSEQDPQTQAASATTADHQEKEPKKVVYELPIHEVNLPL